MNLERLDISGNNITNLAPLATLRHLCVLNLSSNKISNLGEIKNAMLSLFHLLLIHFVLLIISESISFNAMFLQF